MVTAPEWSTDSYSNKGRVFIFRGSASGLETTPISTMLGQNDDDHFGDNALTGEDINGDGFDDVVVSASQSDANGTDSEFFIPTLVLPLVFPLHPPVQ